MRARINALSELPKEWRAALARWHKQNKHNTQLVDEQPVPDRNEEYFLYQTLIGAWPFGPLDDTQYRTFCDRIQAYMAKALREAKVHTSWVNPNQAYDEAVRSFIEAILDRTGPNPFLEDFLPFQTMIAQYGIYNSLSQVVLKIAAPGIPDFYQGTELWDFSLVDPDNRRPVDYAVRTSLLADLQHTCQKAGPDRRSLLRELLETRTDGRIKLYVTTTALAYRRTQAPLFLDGEYIPLTSQGSKKDHLCAFARIHQDQAVVVVVPRLVTGLIPDGKTLPLGPGVWEDTRVTVPSWKPASRYHNIFTGEILSSSEADSGQTLPLAHILSECPIALLERMT